MKKIIATVVGVLMVGSLGMSAFAQEVNKGQIAKSPQTIFLKIDDDVPAELVKTVRISSEAAQKLALAVQPGTLYEWKLDVEGGVLVYKAKIRADNRKVEAYVDAMTGEAWRENDPERMKQKVKISADEAKKIALAQVKGTIVKFKLDEDDGQYVYEVELRTANWQEVDVEISATTGAVLEVDWDD
ncbi:MAG: PepSY domain-containing protein [Clostridia bacterium]